MRLTPIERKALTYILPSTARHTASFMAAGIMQSTKKRGTAQALTRLAGKFTYKLRQQGLVAEERPDGFHRAYFITVSGRDALKAAG
jgi:hypothetical protein